VDYVSVQRLQNTPKMYSVAVLYYLLFSPSFERLLDAEREYDLAFNFLLLDFPFFLSFPRRLVSEPSLLVRDLDDDE
jgi:hypothetical protein